MKTLLIICLCFLYACDIEHECYVCNKVERDSVKAFVERNNLPVLSLTKEEREYFLRQVQKTAIQTICPKRFVVSKFIGRIDRHKSNLKPDETPYPEFSRD